MKREEFFVGVVVCLFGFGGCASTSTDENTHPSEGGAEAQAEASTLDASPGFSDASTSDGPAIQSVTFYADATWTCPPDVTTIFLTGTGGGGAGGGFGTGSTAGYSNGCIDPQQGGCFEGGGGGGGGAAAVAKQQITVSPGTAYTIVIGHGGGHSPPYQVGIAGGDTTFGSLLTLAGGGGANNVFNGAPGAAGGSGGQAGAQGGSQGGKGGDTSFGIGGGGSGAGDPGTGYGAGGGGTTWSAAGTGGDGAPGFLEIEWYAAAVSQ